MPINVVNVPSCCVGLQFKDFPGAHFEAVKSDKQTVLDLLGQMKTRFGTHFFIAFVNGSQVPQMKGIFKFLGWKAHRGNDRVTCYIHSEPRKWAEDRGVLRYLSSYDMSNTAAGYNVAFVERMTIYFKETREKREAFFADIYEKYGITREDLAFLGKFE